MRRLVVVFLLFAVVAWAEEPTSRNPAELPVKRVVLYKNGVGYFEHAGRVSDNQELNIQFTTGQLNDVLKSLTVVDLGGGKISSVRYNSIAPLNERLSTLRVRLGEQTSRAEFLNALRGARVEVRDGSVSAIGKLLSVEATRHFIRDQFIDQQQVAILTEAGEMRTFDLTPATSVRIVEQDLNHEVGRYLNLIGSSRAKDLRTMNIATAGKGDRDVMVSYISEVPVWKSTYRIVMPKDDKQKPLLQGWAIVDNTIGEDWKDVQLSLVAGSPQSFVQQISQPMYARRPSVDLPQSAMLTPQTHEATMDAPPPPASPSATAYSIDGVANVGGGGGGGVGSGNGPGVGPGSAGGFAGGSYQSLIPMNRSDANANIFGRVTDATGAVVPNARITVVNKQTGAASQATTNSAGNYSIAAAPGDSKITIESPGFKVMQYNQQIAPFSSRGLNATLQMAAANETVEVTSSAPTVNTESAMLASRTSSMAVDAEGRPLGQLFEYALQQKITVLQNQSALVPIVQAPITAERVTLWNSEDAAPLRALWVKNTSGVTLDAGSFNIIEGDSFAGEGMLSELHPDERRLLSYAADTAVRVESEDDDKNENAPYTRLVIAKGMMKLTREERNAVTYKIRNSDTQSREVVIEHPAQEGWKLEDGLKPEESSSSFHRFRVKVDPDKTAELKVAEFRPESAQYVISNLTSDQITLFVDEKAITPALEKSFRTILAKKSDIAAVDNSTLMRRQEINRINGEQSRLRENMKALRGSSEEKALLQRYVQQLNSQEDRLVVLNREITKLEELRSSLSGQLDDMIQKIAIDEKLDHGVEARASN
jgi:hypothetical protein